MRARLAPLLAFLPLVACSPSGSVCDPEALAACIADQRACAVVSGAPTCQPCAQGTRVNVDGACTPLTGTPLTHAFDDNTVEPFEEVFGLCRSWTLNNEEELWVTAVEISQDEQSHHSNWTFVPDTMFPGEDGIWPCDERGYDQLAGAVAGGVLYAQSTQATHEVQAFAEGAAIRLPPHARIIGDIHILNTTAASHTGNLEMSIYTVPRAEVTMALLPFHINYLDLNIPARGSARFVADCELRSLFEEALGGRAPSVRIHYALPHTHSLGTRVFLQVVGGARDSEMLLDVGSYNGEARGLLYDPPIDVSDFTGLRFGCEFENPRDVSVGHGIGDQEMCEMLGFLEAEVQFDSHIPEREPLPDADGLSVFGGVCSTAVLARRRGP